MAGDDANTPKPESKTLHPVYSVANIQNKIRTLDGVKVTYSAWVKLHARGYRVLNHIDGTAPPAKTDPTYESWAEIDAIVLQWVYGTLSDDLLVRVLDAETTARLAWEKIQNIFISNKSSRAATLEHEFTNTTLSSCASLDDYCQKLKDLAEQLGDVDHPVTESRLVLQLELVRGLPTEFDTVASFINQSSTTWDNARSMLQLEQHRQNARQQPTLVASRSNPQPPPPPPGFPAPVQDTSAPNSTVYDQGSSRSFTRGRGRGRRGGGRNNNNNRGGGRSGSGYPAQPTPPGFSTQPLNAYAPWGSPAAYQPWAPPPCPYPTQASAWPAPWSNKTPAGYDPQVANMAAPQPFPNAANTVPGVDALNPTDLGAALNTLHLNTQDPNWYMDSGASSHLTNEPRSQEWKGAFPPQ
ncbi:putative RNA-directed DNA polymerase [Helianthus annuus]|nr:putative RNA-directed DNA polymerase [Helianthus annuus]